MMTMKEIRLGKYDQTEQYEIFDCPCHLAELLSDAGLIEPRIKESQHRIVILSGKEQEVNPLLKDKGYALKYGP
jgi:hypothetical protein